MSVTSSSRMTKVAICARVVLCSGAYSVSVRPCATPMSSSAAWMFARWTLPSGTSVNGNGIVVLPSSSSSSYANSAARTMNDAIWSRRTGSSGT